MMNSSTPSPGPPFLVRVDQVETRLVGKVDHVGAPLVEDSGPSMLERVKRRSVSC